MERFLIRLDENFPSSKTFVISEVCLDIIESTLKRHVSREISFELRKAILWLEGLGTRVTNTRIEQYQKHLLGEQDKTSFEGYKKALLTRKELDEFLIIYRAFGTEPRTELQQKFERIVSGYYYRADDDKNKSDPARDYLNELYIAARLKLSGLDVDVAGECDIVVSVEHKKIYIECKRVRSPAKLIARIKEAGDQVEKRVGVSESNSCGYVVVNVTDLLITNKDIKVYDDMYRFKSYAFERLKSLISEKDKDEIRRKINKEVLGVVFYSHMLGIVKVLDAHQKDKPVIITAFSALGCEKDAAQAEFNSRFFSFLCR